MRFIQFFILAAIFVTAASAAAAPSAGLPDDHPFLRQLALAGVERGREHRALLIVPIAQETEDPADLSRPLTSVEALKADHLSIGEPEKKAGHTVVEVFNWTTRPILLLAGEALEGGHRDRFLTRDVLLGPGQRAEAPVHHADARARAPDDRKVSLAPIGALAPDLPRALALTSGNAALTRAWLANAFSVIEVRDPRTPFPALLTAQKLVPRIDDYQNTFAKIPDEAERRVFGYAAFVGDRLVGMDTFASNAAFRANWPVILKSLGFQAAYYEFANGLSKHPFPAGRDPDRHKQAVKGFIKKVFAASVYKQTGVNFGTEFQIARPGLVGRLLMHEEKLVHSVLLPDLDTLADRGPAPGTGPAPETTVGELLRKASRSRLTEYERRLLERMLKRRGTPPNRPTPPVIPPVPQPGEED